MGRSKLVPDLRISDGERLRINLRGGMSIALFLKADLIRSFDSFIIISGSQIISIVGNDLFVATSIVISCPMSHSMAYVFILWIMVESGVKWWKVV